MPAVCQGCAGVTRSLQEVQHPADTARFSVAPASLVARCGGKRPLFRHLSPKLGDEYRLFIFQQQNFITKQNLRGVTEKWAEDHKVTLPFVVDPSGKLIAQVDADRDMGTRIPLDHTPTIYIVNDSGHGAAITEVPDLTQLYRSWTR